MSRTTTRDSRTSGPRRSTVPRATARVRTGPAVLLLIALTGCAAPSGTASEPRPAATAGATAPRTDPASPPPSGDSGAKGASDTAPAAPVSLSIPSIGVNSAVMRLGLNADGTVEVPPADKGMTTGWYTGGPVPGAPGPAVLIGHNETRFGRAVFRDLKKIAQGADITVRDARGTEVHFKVTGRETVGKKAFPTERVYGATKGRVLRLITCDGAFDAQGHPVDNLIVYAMRS
ncbi:class F sortase [Streptomyces sp. NPDC051561]|uniref:class F sortase n=1 Tax=Streptomyces sp. NPDC051561 TaxID=3365658 RepID=UPI003794B5B2